MIKGGAMDFLKLDDLVTDEERMVRDTIRSFVQKELLPIIEEHHREGKFPAQLVPQLAELGVFGPTLKGYGCSELSYTAYGLMMRELERGDSGLRSFVS